MKYICNKDENFRQNLIIMLIGPTCSGKTTVGNKILDLFGYKNADILKFGTTRPKRSTEDDDAYDFVREVPDNAICVKEYNTVNGPYTYFMDFESDYNKKSIHNHEILIWPGAHYSYIKEVCEYFSHTPDNWKVYILPIFILADPSYLFNRFYDKRVSDFTGDEYNNALHECCRRVYDDYMDYSAVNCTIAFHDTREKYGNLILLTGNSDNIFYNNDRSNAMTNINNAAENVGCRLNFYSCLKCVHDFMRNHDLDPLMDTTFISISKSVSMMETSVEREFYDNQNCALLSSLDIEQHGIYNYKEMINDRTVVLYDDHWKNGPYISYNDKELIDNMLELLEEECTPNNIIILRR